MTEKNVPKLRFSGFTKVWESTRIGEIAEVVGGGTPKTEVEEYWNGEIKWFTPSEIGKTKYIFDSERHISDNGLKNSSAKLLPKYTILLSSRATVGEISIALTECSTNQGFQSLITKNNVDNEFIYYLISTIKNEFLRRSSGSTFLEISKNEIKRIPINIPELSEQNKISNLFSAIDNKIEMLEKKCQYYQDFKKYLMQRIFSSQDDKLRFADNENWKTVKLGDVCKITMGQSPSSENYSENNFHTVLIQGNADIINGKVVPRVYTSEITKISKPGDIIMTVRAPVGDLAINEFESCIGRGVCSIEGNKFIYYLLQSLKDNHVWERLSQGSTFESINSNDIKNLKVKMPSEETQNTISLFLTEIDSKIELYEIQFLTFQKLKKGLLQQMFV